MNGKRYFLGITPDGRRRYACDYGLPPIAGGAPDECNDQIDTGTDDGGEIIGTGAMDMDCPSITMRASANPNIQEWVAFRFHNGPWPSQGATIDVAYMQIHSVDYGSNDDVDVDIHAENAAAPLTLTEDDYNITSRSRTTAFAPWVQDNLPLDSWNQTPSLVDVIQELVDSLSVSAVVLIYKTADDVSKNYNFFTQEHGDHSLGAKLHLEWTEPGHYPLEFDTYLLETTPNINQGASATISVGRTGLKATDDHHALFRLDLASAEPGKSGSDVVSAYLKLYVYEVNGNPESSTFPLYRCKRNTVEGEATWNIWSAGNNWATAGGLGADTDYDSADAASFTGPSETGLFSIDITDWIKDILDNHSGDVNGIIHSPEVNTRYFRFRSKEYNGDDPYIEIEWGAGETHYKSVGGTLTSAGNLTTRPTKVLIGALTPTGTLSKLRAESLVGTLPSRGRLTREPTITSGDQIDTGSDDGEERVSDGLMCIGDFLTIWLDASDNPVNRRWAGFRFHNGPFPVQGATILEAYLEIYVVGVYDDANGDIYVQKAASPATLTTTNYDLSSRPRTTASVAWVEDDLGIGWAQSPSLVDVIQELVDSHGPTAIMVIFKGRSDLAKQLRVSPEEHGQYPERAAKLHLKWTYDAGSHKQSLAGTLTSGGTLVAQCRKGLAGAVSSAGALARQTQTTFTGTLTPVGALAAKGCKMLAGTLTPTGYLASKLLVARFYKTVTGVLASSGALTRKTARTLTGALGLGGAPGTVEPLIEAGVDDGPLMPLTEGWENTDWYMPLGSDRYGWWHWPSVAVPRNAVIQVAKIQFRCYSSDPEECDLRIEGCDEDDSAALASWADYVSRPKTSLVNWNGVEVWTAYGLYWSASIKTIVEAITSRPGWSSGQAMQVIVKGLVPYGEATRCPGAYDGGAAYAAKLYIEYTVPGGGLLSTVATRYRSLAGTLSSTGVLVSKARKALKGTLASSGTLVAQTSRMLAGVLTSSGVLTTVATWYRSFAGTVAPTGYLGAIKFVGTYYKTLAGVLVSSGVLARKTTTSLAGTLTSSGALATAVAWYRTLTGTVSSAGALHKKATRTLAGVLTSVGVVVPRVGKALSGVVSSVGTLAKTVYKYITPISLSGTLAPSGALWTAKVTPRALAGTVTSAGTLVTQFFIGKVIGGALTSTGALAVKVSKTLGGTLAPAGGLVKRSWRAFAGVLSAAGSLIARLWGPGKTIRVEGSVDTTLTVTGSVDTTLRVEGSDDTTIEVEGEF